MKLIKELMKEPKSGSGSGSGSGNGNTDSLGTGSNSSSPHLNELGASALNAMDPKDRLAVIRQELQVRVKDIYPDMLAEMVCALHIGLTFLIC